MRFLVNWKTTAAGLASIFAALASILGVAQSGDTSHLAVDIGMILAGAGLVFAKDNNVTGGTVPATPEATKRVGATS